MRAALGEADHHVFALIDGLGMGLVESLPAGSFLREHVAMGLRSVFPATTAAALTSLATGLWPAQHAVPAWWTYLPERELTATILPFVERMSERPLDEQAADEAFPERVLLASYRRNALSILPEGIAGSVYSRYASGGMPLRGYSSLPEAVDLAAARVRDAAAPTYTYVYYPALDAAGHLRGPASDEAQRELAGVDRELARLAEGIAGRGRLVVSADHGQIAVAQEDKHLIEDDDALLELLAATPHGEPRVPFFRVREGAGDAFAAAFRERFADWALIAIDEADELRLFGPEPLSSRTRGRIGDYLAITDRAQVITGGSERDRQRTRSMRGFHAGMLPDEMRVPLIVA